MECPLMRRHHSQVGTASRSALALLLVAQPLTAAPLLAQAFRGTAAFDAGKIEIGNDNGSSTIVARAPQATINWTPTDTGTGGGAIDFLPAGNSVTYTSGISGPVTVLNRIIAADPSRQIGLYGNVNAEANVGVWFYAPGGVLVGSTARFNVGSLLLTASDPVADGQGNFIASGNRFTLSAATQAGAAIDIAAGAQINALQGAGSYVIAVAPRVTQAGAIQVDGSAALVAADAVDFTLNAGLFDVTVTQGTSAAGTVITHSGETTGPAAATGANNRIYMVAVPRNDAITLLVSGGSKLGFAIAGAANVDGNSVVLSAGHNIVGTPADPGGIRSLIAPDGSGPTSPVSPFADSPVNSSLASIIVRGGDFSSAVTMLATTTAQIDLTSGTTNAQAFFASDLSLRGGFNALIARAEGGGANLTIFGDLLVSAESRPSTISSPTPRSGGTAALILDPGFSVSIGGNALFNADGNADPGGTGIGGTAYIAGNGGFLDVAGNLGVSAIGRGSFAADGSAAGNGEGGRAEILLNRGSISVGGDTVIVADALGFGSNGALGGKATGGSAKLVVDSGQMLVAGDLRIGATGFGDVDVRGGLASVDLPGLGRLNGAPDGSLQIGGGLFVAAQGVAEGQGLADAAGGTAELSFGGGTLAVAGTSNFDAGAVGSALVLGGNARIFGSEINGSGPATLGFKGLVTIAAEALGGGVSGGFAGGGDVQFVIGPRASVTAASGLTLSAAASARPGGVGACRRG
jgi:filamentous hemagglutinin family protein